MAFPNIFTKDISDAIIERINKLTRESERQWGKMDVAKMLAHCNVAYETIYEPDKHPKPKFPMSLILKTYNRRANSRWRQDRRRRTARPGRNSS